MNDPHTIGPGEHTHIGSGIWSQITPEQLRILRQAAARALFRCGVPNEAITPTECDKWIESRLPDTIARHLHAGHGR